VDHIAAISQPNDKSRNQSIAEKIAKKGGKICKILWRYEIQFKTLFVIATSSNSSRILNYLKDSESRLV
jgi:hypothetical protein